MWRKVSAPEEKEFLEKAIAFTGNHELYGHWMIEAVVQWPVTCEHNLTDDTQNRRAFVGHCAACLAIQCPEYITRTAWGYLSREQQELANKEADKAISFWEDHRKKERTEDAQAVFEF
jgi:hypothetical protein